ncbi:potassium channel family protein [Gordonia sp. (in: high G+C Gram-positive bacteria)]|uniref:potassium channel family protein n=2 Tax=Gordonia sp. (in: high G+C Gram-positive bacteria) TaxID=84139 RepID=UPI003C742299
MTEQMDDHSDQRGVSVRYALLRPLGATIILLAGYFLLPIGGDSKWQFVGLIVGVVLLAAFCAWEVRHFLRSDRPVATAIEMLAAVMCFYIVTFSSAYFLLGDHHLASFTQPLTRVDALYFCLTVFTTTGFGDIAAVSQPARIAVSIQMASTLALVGLGLRFVNVVIQNRIPSVEKLHRYRNEN